jgi:hypothetical protein
MWFEKSPRLILVFFMGYIALYSPVYGQTCPGELPPEAQGLLCDLYSISHGCLYEPSSHLPENDTLVLYIRGNYKGRADVPAAQTQNSINELIQLFQLGKVSEETSLPLYMTTSSNNNFDVRQILHLSAGLKLRHPVKIIIAAHSGGYRGMYQTLQNLLSLPQDYQVIRLIMLDNFYMEDAWVQIFSDYINSGTECRGFVTDHNVRRLRDRFLPQVRCQVEGPQGFEHNQSVVSCLKPYLSGKNCR